MTLKYASDNVGKVKAMIGLQHDYLMMIFDFLLARVRVDIVLYIKSMVNEFPKEYGNSKITSKLESIEGQWYVEIAWPGEVAKIFFPLQWKECFCTKEEEQISSWGLHFWHEDHQSKQGDWAYLFKIVDFFKTTQDDVA